MSEHVDDNLRNRSYKSDYPQRRPVNESAIPSRQFFGDRCIGVSDQQAPYSAGKLRQEGIISDAKCTEFPRHHQPQRSYLTQTSFSNIEEDPELQEIPSFPWGVPGKRDIKGQIDPKPSPMSHHENPWIRQSELENSRNYKNDISSRRLLDNPAIPSNQRLTQGHEGRYIGVSDQRAPHFAVKLREERIFSDAKCTELSTRDQTQLPFLARMDPKPSPMSHHKNLWIRQSESKENRSFKNDIPQKRFVDSQAIPTSQGAKYIGLPDGWFERLGDKWAPYFAQKLREEGTISDAECSDFLTRYPEQRSYLSQEEIDLVERDPVFKIRSFPRGVPGSENIKRRVDPEPSQMGLHRSVARLRPSFHQPMRQRPSRNDDSIRHHPDCPTQRNVLQPQQQATTNLQFNNAPPAASLSDPFGSALRQRVLAEYERRSSYNPTPADDPFVRWSMSD